MITATFIKKNNEYISFSCEGHAEFDDYGKDIVCSAVSMLVINTANSIEKLTNNKIIGSDKGVLHWEFITTPDEYGRLLMDSMLLGLSDIKKKYGNDYLILKIEEV
ncbi:MAG: ribosomal-processing cysteine protease Prp [Lachnospiraceae bacterium]|nr:ribosomal-processing cysteine protease Prp [Lachnospiraceae bacterium]